MAFLIHLILDIAIFKARKLRRPKLKYKVSGILIIIILAGVLLTACGSGTGEDKASSTLVYQIAQDHVKKNLKNPRSAEFPLDKISDHVYKKEGEKNEFVIQSYVIVENVFGGTTRHDFVTEVKFLGDNKYRSYNLKFVD